MIVTPNLPVPKQGRKLPKLPGYWESKIKSTLWWSKYLHRSFTTFLVDMTLKDVAVWKKLSDLYSRLRDKDPSRLKSAQRVEMAGMAPDRHILQ
jgi:hypothetical protein